MDLNKENMKKICYLITFAVFLYLGVQNFGMVIVLLKIMWGFMLPFILGGAIAFILNVPMKFMERRIFGKALEKKNKAAMKFARPVSLILALLSVILIIMVVVLVVVPELATTIVSVAKKIEESIPAAQSWIMKTFNNNPQILKWANSFEFHPQEIINSVGNMLKSGVNNILSSTVSLTMGIVSTAMNVCIGFIFSFYILLQKEKLSRQVKKLCMQFFHRML